MAPPNDEPLIYRSEVLAIIGHLPTSLSTSAKFEMSLWRTMKAKGRKEPSKRQVERAATVQRLRELEARGWAELKARRRVRETKPD